MNKLSLYLLAMILCGSSKGFATPRQKLVLGANDLPAYAQLQQEAYQVVNRQSDRFEFELEYFPNKRTFIVANDGLVDGAAMKPDAAHPEETANLIKISTPLFTIRSIVAIQDKGEDIESTKDLQKHKVAMINGSIHAMNLIPPKQRIFINSHLSGLLMVAHGRIEAMLTLDIPYYQSVMESSDVAQKTRLATFSRRVHFYMFIHKKHKKLVPELEDLMKKVAASGDVQDICDHITEGLKHNALVKR